MGLVTFHPKSIIIICLGLFMTCSIATTAVALESPKYSPPKSGKSTIKLMKPIKKPTNPEELLNNLKFAFKNELLLQDDFYTDENLKKMFGCNNVKWISNKSNYKYPMIYNFAGLFEKANRYKGMGMDVVWEKLDSNKSVSDTGKVHVRVNIPSFEDSRFRVEVVEKVFGTKMQVEDLYKNTSLRHPEPLSPGNHRLGNKSIRYTFSSSTVKSLFGCVVNGDGTIDRCNLRQNVL